VDCSSGELPRTITIQCAVNPPPPPPPPTSPFCGDGTCDSGENCSNCSADCGICPPPPPSNCPTQSNFSSNCNNVSLLSTAPNTNNVSPSCSGTDCTGTYLIDCDSSGNWTNIRDNCYVPPPPTPPPPSGQATSFIITSEAKGGNIGTQLDFALLTYPDIAFGATLGDLVPYQPNQTDWDNLAAYLSNFTTSRPHYPTKGDHEIGGFVLFYGLPLNYYFDVNDYRFFVFDHRYTGPTDIIENLADGNTTTVQLAIEESGTLGLKGIIFNHYQWYVNVPPNTGCAGQKSYANNPPSSMTSLFEANNILVVFQADNAGWCDNIVNGIHYIKVSGFGRYYLGGLHESGQWFVLYEDDGFGNITVSQIISSGNLRGGPPLPGDIINTVSIP